MHVYSESLLTTRELFYLVGIKGYDIRYHRIPIIEHNPPSLVSQSMEVINRMHYLNWYRFL